MTETVTYSCSSPLPLTPHLPAFEAAHSLGLHVTAHAGEAAGPDSVREVLDRLGPQRIGHGVAAATDIALISRLAHDGVALEMCPLPIIRPAQLGRASPIQQPRCLRRA